MQTIDRTEYIGGSDIAAIMNMSDFGDTPLSVWAVKTKKIPPKDLSNIESVELGTELEDFVAKRFQKKSGFQVRRDSRSFVHPQYDYMRAHIDRWIVGEDALLECKTTSAYQLKKWEGDKIPHGYVLQVMWYLGILGKTTGYIAVLIGGQKFMWKSITFDKELFDLMVDRAKDFWENFVQKNVAPVAQADDNDLLAELFAHGTEDALVLNGEDIQRLDNLVEERQGGVEQKKLIETDLADIEAKIKQMLGKCSIADTGKHIVTWKEQRVAPFIDTEAMKNAGVYTEYEVIHTGRVLRTKVKKSK